MSFKIRRKGEAFTILLLNVLRKGDPSILLRGETKREDEGVAHVARATDRKQRRKTVAARVSAWRPPLSTRETGPRLCAVRGPSRVHARTYVRAKVRTRCNTRACNISHTRDGSRQTRITESEPGGRMINASATVDVHQIREGGGTGQAPAAVHACARQRAIWAAKDPPTDSHEIRMPPAARNRCRSPDRTVIEIWLPARRRRKTRGKETALVSIIKQLIWT